MYASRLSRDPFGIVERLSDFANLIKNQKGTVTLEDIHEHQRNKLLTGLVFGAASGLILHSALEHQTILLLGEGIKDVGAIFAGLIPPAAVVWERRRESKFLKGV